MKEAGKMRRAMKAQLLIAVILVSATGAMSAETANQAGGPAPMAATEIAVPKVDAAKKHAPAAAGTTEIAGPKADATKQADARKPETADQTTPPAVVAATELPAPKADVRKLDARKPQAQVSWHCGWFPWACSSGRVGLILGTAY